MPAPSVPTVAQVAVIDAPATATGTVIGGPGTGKTYALVERVAALIAGGLAPEQVLALTPNRQAATALRDRIGVRVRVATPGPLARSLGSFAFQLVRGTMVHSGQEPPALLTGADQDRIIADLLAGDAEDEAEPGRSTALAGGARRDRALVARVPLGAARLPCRVHRTGGHLRRAGAVRAPRLAGGRLVRGGLPRRPRPGARGAS